MASLTSKGQPGAPKVLTAEKWGFYETLLHFKEFVLKRLYESWVMESVGFKLYPVEGHATSACEPALKVVDIMKQDNTLAEQDIEAVRIRTQGPAFTIVNKQGPLRNAADRDHCIQYIIAVILLKGAPIDTVDYTDDSPWVADPRVDALREKVSVVEDSAFKEDYRNLEKRSCANAIQVGIKASQKVIPEVVVEYPRGHPARQDTLEQVAAKFKQNMSLAFGSETIGEMLRAVEQDNLAVKDFVDLFWLGDK